MVLKEFLELIDLIVVTPIKMGRNFGFVCFKFFIFVFYAKSATTKNHWTGLNDISH